MFFFQKLNHKVYWMIQGFFKCGFVNILLRSKHIKMAIPIVSHIWWDIRLSCCSCWWCKNVLLNTYLHFMDKFPQNDFFFVHRLLLCVFFFSFFLFLTSSLLVLDGNLLRKEMGYDLPLFFHFFFSTSLDFLFSCFCLTLMMVCSP